MLRPWNRTTAHAVALALVVSAISACSDEADLNAPALPGPQHAVVDLTGGHFSFLAPLGDGTKNGVFNPRLSPVVEICRLATTTEPVAATPCAATVAWFGTDSGSGTDRVTVDTRREMYSVVWNLAPYDLATGYYRVFVRTAPGGGRTFGFADLAVGRSRSEARALGGTAVHATTATSDLPIKFRIETGSLCAQYLDCFEGSVGPAGGTFITPAEDAGVEFPAGALSDTRTLIMYRLTADDVDYCLPTAQPQYEGCYRFLLEPALAPGETFALEATAGVCLDPAAAPFEKQLLLQKWDEVDPSTLTTLPRREIDFLECGDFTVASLDAGGTFSTLASAGGRFIGAIASAFLPQPLYAGTRSPYGGGLNDFSRIGWVRPLTISAVSGRGQSACASSTLPQPLQVRVEAILTGDAVAGVPLVPVTAYGGFTSPAQTVTDADGMASMTWTLGAFVGEQVIDVKGYNPLTGWPQYAAGGNWSRTTFTADATGCVP